MLAGGGVMTDYCRRDIVFPVEWMKYIPHGIIKECYYEADWRIGSEGLVIHIPGTVRVLRYSTEKNIIIDFSIKLSFSIQLLTVHKYARLL